MPKNGDANSSNPAMAAHSIAFHAAFGARGCVALISTPANASNAASRAADRWLLLYPAKPKDGETRYAEICANPLRLKLLRERRGDLSWFMKSPAEPIARMANLEDRCKADSGIA